MARCRRVGNIRHTRGGGVFYLFIIYRRRRSSLVDVRRRHSVTAAPSPLIASWLLASLAGPQNDINVPLSAGVAACCETEGGAAPAAPTSPRPSKRRPARLRACLRSAAGRALGEIRESHLSALRYGRRRAASQRPSFQPRVPAAIIVRLLRLNVGHRGPSRCPATAVQLRLPSASLSQSLSSLPSSRDARPHNNSNVPITRPSILIRMTGQPSCPTLGRARPAYSAARLFKPSGSSSLVLLPAAQCNTLRINK